ncbi:MAG: type 1 glutamine amidotransferase [Candidatus Dactylopiibacterium sp.]|nr:type 1 glutamine amidotransferase [Candidatus Dactylopiibacterium sp.]
MKPIVVFQHSALVGPGHFASFLEARKLAWRLVRIDLGEPVPAAAEPFSGLCFLGGEMSVNDDLPWIAHELELIRDAMARDVPVIGHCLGGQLMARALGARVSRNAVREIGWGRLEAATSAGAREWLGDVGSFEGFHWHRETFALPAHAEPLLSSAFCANQAFAIGPHLGMQCHVEMTAPLIESWVAHWPHDLAHGGEAASVQGREAVLDALDARLAAMHAVSERLYARWLAHVLARVQRPA